MEKYYQIAGIGIRVRLQGEGSIPTAGVLENFISEECLCEYEIEIEVVDILPSPKGVCIYYADARAVYKDGATTYQYFGVYDGALAEGYQCLCKKGNLSKLWVKKSYLPNGLTGKTILNALELEDLAIKEGGVILHASYVTMNGEAILFTAPSGTGKSTQAKNWCEFRGAELINGDRVIVKKQENGYYTYGIPFSGSSGVRLNKTFPLKAIIYLKQAPENKVKRINGFQAFQKVWEGCSMRRWDREEIETCMGIVLDVIAAVPVYELACTPDYEAVEVLEEALKERKYD